MADNDNLSKGRARRNEVRKARAAFLNRLAVASIAIGVATPIAAILLATELASPEKNIALLAFGLLALGLGMVLRAFAIGQVERIED